MSMTNVSYRPEDLRNLVLLGHGGAGKTLLAEALLHRTGVISRMGSVENESTTSDFEPEARAHHHSTSSTLLFATHEKKELNFIDTPGHPEFVGPALAALSAVETAVIVVNATAGVEFNTRRLFHAAAEAGLARMIVVNKIDLAPDRLPRILSELKAVFGPKLHAINLPAQGRTAVIDCFEQDAGVSDFGSVKDAHREMVESVVELDDAQLEAYLSGARLPAQQLRSTFVKAMSAGQVVPVLFTSARTGVGIDALLKVIVDDVPSPVTGRRRRLLKHGLPVELDCTVDAPLLAHVFKVTTDPHLGPLAMVRVLQGKLDASTPFVSAADARPRKPGHVLKVEGRDHPELEAVACAGELVALARVENLHVDQLLHAPELKASFEVQKVTWPPPMLSLAIASRSRADDVKLGQALTRLTEEDQTFSFAHEPLTHELVLSGLGELHLKVMLEKLNNRARLDVRASAPTIPYRETIGQRAEAHHRHKKQSGGAGQFAEVYLRVEPLPRGGGFEFKSEVFGGSIPPQFIPSVEKGVHDALERGVLAGYPVHDVRVVVTDGKTHPVDSKDIAFRTAAKMAVRDALGRARPALLEPVVNLEVSAPEASVGAVTGELKTLRARVMGLDTQPDGMTLVRAQAPLAELSGYGSQLRGSTGGQGSFVIELAHYEPVPQHVHNKLVETRAAHRAQDSE
jgi:elongation factor G